jgi:hypothetical protein
VSRDTAASDQIFVALSGEHEARWSEWTQAATLKTISRMNLRSASKFLPSGVGAQRIKTFVSAIFARSIPTDVIATLYSSGEILF